MKRLSDIGLFMLDMDGTFYLGDNLLPGGAEFLELCREKGISFTFLTNNSSKSAETYLEKLAALGVRVTPDEMFTSGDATLLYLKKELPDRNILLIGTESLERQYKAAGFDIRSEIPSAVVLGFDTTINYEKLTALCDAVRLGLPYIATHPDFNCPVPGGYIPDIGAVIAFVEASTGRRPTAIIGKPNKGIAEALSDKFSLPLERLCMVGDRLYTDIALGRCGVRTALVLCGETTPEDLVGSDVQPDYIFQNLEEMATAIRAE